MNSLPKTVTRQRRDCDFISRPSAPGSSTLTTRLPSHPKCVQCRVYSWRRKLNTDWGCCRSAVKVISQPNPQFSSGGSGDNPLSVLGQALFPAGNTNAPMEQLQQFYRLGVQAMSKAQAAGGETRSNSAATVANTGPCTPLCVTVMA